MSFRIKNDAYQLFGLFYRMGWILIFEFPYKNTTKVLTGERRWTAGRTLEQLDGPRSWRPVQKLKSGRKEMTENNT